jgi:hypothetical protein
VVGNELGHFEHRDLGFAAEDSFELVICVNHAAVRWILEIELLDVVPRLPALPMGSSLS